MLVVLDNWHTRSQFHNVFLHNFKKKITFSAKVLSWHVTQDWGKLFWKASLPQVDVNKDFMIALVAKKSLI